MKGRATMNIVILDDYKDAVRKLRCATQLDAYNAKVYTNTVKGLGQLAVRLRDADIIVLIRERTHIIATVDGPLMSEDLQTYTRLDPQTIVSMNLWGFG